GGLVGVGRTGVGDAVAALGDVADAGRRPADRRALLVGRTVVAHAVAALRNVAGARGRAADRRALGIGRTARAGPGAVLGRVACAGRGAAHDGRRLEGVRRAACIRTVAGLVGVARTGRRPAQGAGVAGRVLADIARPVAGIARARVPVVRARRARGHLP